MKQRTETVVALREQGATLAEIGKRVGCTRERVRQILLRHQRRKEAEEHAARVRATLPPADWPILALRTSVRAGHALGRWGLDCKTAGDVTIYSRADLMRVPNIGRKTADEIEAALAEIGLALAEET